MTKEQKKVLVEIILGLATIMLVTCLSFHFFPVKTLSTNKAFYLFTKGLPLMAFWLMLFILIRTKQRFFNLNEIHGEAPLPLTHSDLQDRVLKNTGEQLLLAIPLLLALLNKVPGNNILLILLPAFFSIGRLFFWLGYYYSPLLRGYGFALTCYPMVLSYGYLLVLEIKKLT